MSEIITNKNLLLNELDNYIVSEMEERDLWMSVRDAVEDNEIGGGDSALKKIKEIRKVETLLETLDVTGIVYPDKKYIEIFWNSNSEADIYKVLRSENDLEPVDLQGYEIINETGRNLMTDFKIKTKTRYWYKVSAYKVETVIIYEDLYEFKIDKPFDAFEY